MKKSDSKGIDNVTNGFYLNNNAVLLNFIKIIK